MSSPLSQTKSPKWKSYNSSKKAHKQKSFISNSFGQHTQKIIFKIMSVPFKITAFLINYIKVLIIKNQAASLFLIGLLLVGFCFYRFTKMMVLLEQRSLPQTISISVPNSEVRFRIQKAVSKSLHEAEKHHMNRVDFLSNLSSSLKNIENIDEVWIRSGLDKQLQITATVQIPTALLETSNGDFIIGHRMKIIQKITDGQLPMSGILKLHVSEIKIVSSNLTPQLVRILMMSQTIKNQVMMQNFNSIQLEKILWQPDLGFTAVFEKSTPQEKPMTSFSAALGESDFDQKLKRLHQVFNELQEKNIDPVSIDLNYQNKAIVRLAQSNQNITL